MKLQEAIAVCCEQALNRGEEFDADDVLECLYTTFPEQIAQYASNLTRTALRTRVASELKRRGGLDHLQPYLQLNLAGFEGVPAIVSFYDGEKVRYIAALRAREEHVLGTIKLSEDNIRFCEARLVEYRRMLDCIRGAGIGATFGDALAMRSARLPEKNENAIRETS